MCLKDVLICIDAGHGRYTAGKRCWKALDPAETREWELNRRVAEALERRLADCPCRVLRADDRTGAVDVPLSQRVQRANRAGAAVYLSIHHNAGVGGGPGGGIVVFSAPGASGQARALRDRVYARTVARTGLRGNRAQPLGESGYYVLRKTAMPAVLGEFGFMDSRTDVPVILSPGFAEQIAQGLAEALAEQFGWSKEEEPMTYEQWKTYMERYRRELAAQTGGLETLWQEARGLGLTDGSRPGDLATRAECAAMARAAVLAAQGAEGAKI